MCTTNGGLKVYIVLFLKMSIGSAQYARLSQCDYCSLRSNFCKQQQWLWIYRDVQPGSACPSLLPQSRWSLSSAWAASLSWWGRPMQKPKHTLRSVTHSHICWVHAGGCLASYCSEHAVSLACTLCIFVVCMQQIAGVALIEPCRSNRGERFVYCTCLFTHLHDGVECRSNKSKPSGRHPVQLTSNFQADLNTIIAVTVPLLQHKCMHETHQLQGQTVLMPSLNWKGNMQFWYRKGHTLSHISTQTPFCIGDDRHDLFTIDTNCPERKCQLQQSSVMPGSFPQT